jgi:hypothetical protein
MKKNFGFVMAVAVLATILAWTGSVQAYTVTGNVTSGWGTTGGDLWYDILKETASSTAGQYDDVGDNPCGVIVRPPTTQDLPNPLDFTNHNWIEVDYILATGWFGHRVLYSVGELDPRFGNGTVTVNCDKKGRCGLTGLGRDIYGLANIDVVRAFTQIKSVKVDGVSDVHPYSPALVVSGVGIRPQSYDLAALQAMPQVTFDDTTTTSNTIGTWTGPTLLDVLKDAGVDTRDMDSYIIVQATDGYATLLSMYEATHNAVACPSTSTTCPLPLLAISDTYGNTLNNGTCTDALSANTKCKDNGFVRLVLPTNLAAGRWVSNTVQIIVYKLESCEGHWR